MSISLANFMCVCVCVCVPGSLQVRGPPIAIGAGASSNYSAIKSRCDAAKAVNQTRHPDVFQTTDRDPSKQEILIF